MRWDRFRGDRVENAHIDAFVAEIKEVCRKYNVTIGHEDGHGAFIVQPGFNESLFEWFASAMIGEFS